MLAQAIVAAAKRFPEKSVRSVLTPCSRVPFWSAPSRSNWTLDVITEGRTTATTVVSATQNGKRYGSPSWCSPTSPSGDVIRHHLPRPDVAAPAEANRTPSADGRTRNCVWSTSSTSTAPTRSVRPGLFAWLHYDPIPGRDDLRKALVAYFTGHLGISTTMRAHEGMGTSQAHLTVSTAPMTVSVSFHEPFRVGRLDSLQPREHAGRCGHVLRAGRRAHRGGRADRILRAGRHDPAVAHHRHGDQAPVAVVARTAERSLPLENVALLTDPWVFGSAGQGGAVAAEGEHGQGDECLGERNPNAMRVRSRILVLVESISPWERPWSRAASMASRWRTKRRARSTNTGMRQRRAQQSIGPGRACRSPLTAKVPQALFE